jgi:hypothetical protein
LLLRELAFKELAFEKLAFEKLAFAELDFEELLISTAQSAQSYPQILTGLEVNM